MTIKQIDQLLEESESLKAITQAYSEIANLKIKRIRTEVERNRIFFQEISQVYALIKKLAAKKNIVVQKPKKTVSIVLTSNYRFYGSINSDLLDYFLTYTSKIETEKIALGKAAVEFFRAQHSNNTSDYREVLLKGDQPDGNEMLYLVNLVHDYNQVLVFYSGMKSLLVQVPTVLDVTASNTAHLEGVKAHLPGGRDPEESLSRFIFEPDISKILQFFDSQIITLLLEGTFLESELSRTASRFISMDSAENEANKLIKQYQTVKAYVKRNMDNNTILENFATMMAVKRQV